MLITLRVLHARVERVIRTDRETITVGRSSGCTIVLDDPALSRTHCQFERTGQRLFVRDLNSRNGTRIEGELISKSVVRPGERVTCGSAVLTFEKMEKEPDADDPGLKTVELLMERARPLTPVRQPDAQRLQQMLGLLAPLLRGLDREKSLQGILDAAIALLRAERGFLVLVGAAAPSVQLARSAQGEDLAAAEAGISMGIVRRVQQEGVALLVDDAASDEELSALGSVHALQLRSVLCVPLTAGGGVGGVIWLDNRVQRGGFDHRDLALIPFFAELAQIALETGERFAEERSRSRDLEEDIVRGREEVMRATALLDRVRGEEPLRHDFAQFVARSRPMRTTLRLADRAAESDLPVVLVGPTGCGKESLARAIHQRSARAAQPFTAVLCASLPADLVQQELSRALQDSAGGTLYLDGLQDLSAAAQSCVLRQVLQTGSSAAESAQVSVRWMGGSTLPLGELVGTGRFLEELRLRLEGLHIEHPSLAQRATDMPELIDRMLESVQPGMTLGPEARRALCAHDWPGNLAELKSVLQRLSLLRGRGSPTRGEVEECLGPRAQVLRSAVDDLERRTLERTLASCGGSISETARRLGLSRPGLRKMLRRLGLRPPADDGN